MKPGITVHMVVCNEQQWVWYALSSVKGWADEIIVYDTGSTDRTIEAIKAVGSDRIRFEQKGPVSAKGLVALRQEQIDRTSTRWIFLVDGDEVWDSQELTKLAEALKGASDTAWGGAVKTRNCVGDIYHIMPEQFGQYKIGDRRGHLNLRVLRNAKALQVRGVYPDEAFYRDDKRLQDAPEHLLVLPVFYWHMTHMERSAHDPRIRARRKKVVDLGERLPSNTQYPAVFSLRAPVFVSSPWAHRSRLFTAAAGIATPLRRLRLAVKREYQ